MRIHSHKKHSCNTKSGLGYIIWVLHPDNASHPYPLKNNIWVQSLHYLGAAKHYLGAAKHYLGAGKHYLGAVKHYLGAVKDYVGEAKRCLSEPKT